MVKFSLYLLLLDYILDYPDEHLEGTHDFPVADASQMKVHNVLPSLVGLHFSLLHERKTKDALLRALK